MALEPCPDCGRELSPRAPSCPGCGAPRAREPDLSLQYQQNPGKSTTGKVLTWLALIGVIAFGFDFAVRYYHELKGDSEMAEAERIIRRQIGPIGAATLHPDTARARPHGSNIILCGEVTVTRPDAARFALNEERLRTIVVFRPGEGGAATLEPAPAFADSRARFVKRWAEECPLGAK